MVAQLGWGNVHLSRASARSWLPEMVAGACSLPLLVALLLEVAGMPGRMLPIMAGVGVSYLLFGSALVFLPIFLASGAIASEKESGTVEALLLTTQSRRHLIWRRSVSLLVPCLRLVLYSVPVYVLLTYSALSQAIVQYGRALVGTTTEHAGLLSVSRIMVLRDGQLSPMGLSDAWDGTWSGWALLFVGARLACDASFMLMALGVTINMSCRCRSAVRTLIMSTVVVLLVVAVHSCIAQLVGSWEQTMWPSPWPTWLFRVAIPLLIAAEVAIGATFVHKAGTNFDSYVLGERGETSSSAP